MVIKDTFSDKVFKFLNYLFLTFVLLIVLYPLIFIVSASISNPKFVNAGEMWLFPKGINFEGYKMVFKNSQIWNGYKNTIIYTTLGTTINLLVTLPAAYALSRKDFVGRNIIMGILVVTMFISGGLIPSYLLIRNLGMINTIWALIIPNAASVYNVIVTRTFFQTSIPEELTDSARIDGASNLSIFTRIVLPLSLPIIAVMALFYGIGHWNSYFSAMIYLKDQDLYPLQLVLRQILVLQELSGEMTMTQATVELLEHQATVADTVKYAVIIVATLPLIVIYPFMQRFFVKGVMIGSIKG